MRILAISDIHQKIDNLKAILSKVKNESLDLILVAGDITNYGDRGDAAKCFELLDFTRVMAVPGNLDSNAVLSFLEEKGFSLHNKKITFNDFEFCGFGGGLIGKTGEILFSELEIEKKLKQLVSKDSIFLTHLPPKDTPIDLAEDEHIGSAAVKKMIIERGPLLHICGHAHDSAGKIKIGKTVCVNVASVKEGYATKIEIKDKEIYLKRISL
ncbi:MAG: metallophosphoesterase family protein [Candidatus Diapherotrites archaeon]